MLFKKKIIFTEGMNETLCSFDEIPWFSCCGVSYDKPSYYPYLQEKDPKRAEKLLLHTKNYSGTVCLTNLFKEGICRADTFILQTAGWKFYQNEFMPCVEASWRIYEKRASKANGLDLNSAEKRFLRDCGFPDSIDLQLCRMVQYWLDNTSLKGFLSSLYFSAGSLIFTRMGISCSAGMEDLHRMRRIWKMKTEPQSYQQTEV